MGHETDKQWLLVSFYGGEIWRPASKRLTRQSKKFKNIDKVKVFSGKEIVKTPGFSVDVLKFIDEHERGFGYWIWKPLIIERIFDSNPDCAGVIYMDVGCELNFNEESESRFMQYIAYADQNDGLFFSIPFLEEDFTHPKLIEKIGPANPSNPRQIMATTFFLKNSQPARKLIRDWHNIMIEENYNYLLGDDSPAMPVSKVDHPNFRSHRHDQSILSLLVKNSSMSVIPDEQELYPFDSERARDFPIWAARNRLSLSVVSPKGRHVIYRIFRKIVSEITFKRFYL